MWQAFSANVVGWMVAMQLSYVFAVLSIYVLGYTLMGLCGDVPPLWLVGCSTAVVVAFIGTVLTIGWTRLFFKDVVMLENPEMPGFCVFQYTEGPLYTVAGILIAALMLLMIVPLFIRITQVKDYKLTFVKLILLIGIITPVFMIFSFSGIISSTYANALEFIFFAVALGYLQVKYDLVMSASVMKDMSIDKMSEGLLIFNLNGHLIYHNARAEEILTECDWKRIDKSTDFIRKNILGQKLVTLHGIPYEIRESEFRQKSFLVGTIVWIINTSEQSRLVLQEEQARRNETILRESVTALANAVDAKDQYTNGHSTRVAEYAVMIAERMGKSEEYVKNIYFQAILHDVGKIGIEDKILHKEGMLTDEEHAAIQTHCMKGYKILSGIVSYPDLAQAARWHHERYDGRGYPDGLKGSQIPETARIVAVADAYDAMSSDRGYRSFLPRERVISEIRKGIGTQFDPEIGAVWLKIMEEDTKYELRQYDGKGTKMQIFREQLLHNLLL
ncbi:MAG: HD-GYP domain-containing protein [Eubacterium sp.]|nr:HD-GYP domain-containing protein [Eubacterium sp.]